jgi:hypothetical protein
VSTALALAHCVIKALQQQWSPPAHIVAPRCCFAFMELGGLVVRFLTFIKTNFLFPAIFRSGVSTT